jgi:hypothetical protein
MYRFEPHNAAAGSMPGIAEQIGNDWLVSSTR